MTTLREYLSNGASHIHRAPREDEYDDQRDCNLKFDYNSRIREGFDMAMAAEAQDD